MQADAYAGFSKLYEAIRKGGEPDYRSLVLGPMAGASSLTSRG